MSTPSWMVDSPGDEQRRVALRKMRLLATSLLVVAAVIYLVTLPWRAGHGALGWVNAGSEAAMVGALADWFAVTAIFRHPLGVPVPHTALVKRRKNELGRSLQEFVTGNFLTADIIRAHVGEAHVAQLVSGWLSDGANRTRLLAQVMRGARRLLASVRDEDVERLVRETALPRLKEQDFSPLAGRVLADVVRDGAHQQLVDVLARELHSWLERHPEMARRMIGERAPSWSPRWVDKQVVEFGYSQALEWTMQVRMRADHPVRKALDDFLARFADDLQHDPTTMDRAQAFTERVLSNEQITPAVVDLWHGVQGSLLESVETPGSPLWRQLDEWLERTAARLGSDEQLRARVDARVGDAVGFLVDTYGEQLATVISTTVDRWDAEEASSRIELFVGRDLQFIRINGTVVGCLAGLLIHGVSLLV